MDNKSFLKKIKNIFLKNKNSFQTPQAIQEWQRLMHFLGIDPATNRNVLSEVTYYACLKVLSESVGKLPLKLLQHTDKNGIRTAREHPFYKILHDRPNPYMTASAFWSSVELNRNHFGNAYVLIDGAGSSTNLWILPPTAVQVVYDDGKIITQDAELYYIYSGSSKQYVFKNDEVMHFKTSNCMDGFLGKSVAEQLRDTLSGAINSQNLLNKMYKSGFTAKSVLQYTGSMSDEKAKIFAKGIEDYMQGRLKDVGIENIIPIPIGASLTPLNIKLTDNQFLEIKQYTALQIASAFGIKPYQIGDYTKSSYASAEAQQLSFYVDTLLFILKQYEEEITYKLLSKKDVNNGYFSKFNVSAILRADQATQINTLSTAVSSFLMTPNEARGLLDLERKDGGDKLLGNGAAIPVELAGIQYKKEGAG